MSEEALTASRGAAARWSATAKQLQQRLDSQKAAVERLEEQLQAAQSEVHAQRMRLVNQEGQDERLARLKAERDELAAQAKQVCVDGGRWVVVNVTDWLSLLC